MTVASIETYIGSKSEIKEYDIDTKTDGSVVLRRLNGRDRTSASLQHQGWPTLMIGGGPDAFHLVLWSTDEDDGWTAKRSNDSDTTPVARWTLRPPSTTCSRDSAEPTPPMSRTWRRS